MFGTAFTIISVFFNVWTLALLIGLLAISAAIYFIPTLGGPPGLLKFWLTPSTYLAIAGALAVIYMLAATKTIEKQQVQIHQNAVVTKSSTDGVAVLTDNATKQKNQQQVGIRLQKAIDAAPQGVELDALFDQIAREQCSDPANHTRSDCVR